MSSIDNDRFSILEEIYDSPYITPESLKKVFPNSPLLPEILEDLQKQHYISYRIADSFSTDQGYECQWLNEGPHLLALSPGKTIVEQERRHKSELEGILRPLWAQTDRLSRITESAAKQAAEAKIQTDQVAKIASSASNQASSAKELANITKERAELAKAEAESAEKEAKFARTTSIIAIIISIAAIVVPLLCK